MAVRRKQQGAYHHGDLRRALLDATRVELGKVGMQQLSLRGVARRAGVTHGAAYHHFADKEELLKRLAQEGFEKLLFSMHAELDAAGPEPLLRLHAAGVGYLKFALDDPYVLLLMFDGVKIEGDTALHAAADAAFQCLLDNVALTRASRGLTGNPLPHALLYWSLVHGFAALARNQGPRRRAAFGGMDTIRYGSALLDEALTSLYAHTPPKKDAKRRQRDIPPRRT